jgi:hypothetical protein
MFFIDKKIVNVNSDFSTKEWTTLKDEFAMSIRNQQLGTRQLVMGHSLTPIQSAKFTELHKSKLLKEVFVSAPALTFTDAWQDRDFMGRKFLTIDRALFDELLNMYCGGHTASSDPDRKRTRSQVQHPLIESLKLEKRTRYNKTTQMQ